MLLEIFLRSGYVTEMGNISFSKKCTASHKKKQAENAPYFFYRKIAS